MKILLVSVNRERMPYPVFPLGLAYVAKTLAEEGHPIEVIDLCFSKDVHADLKDILLRLQPDLIGISLRNLDNLTFPTSVSYLKETEEVVGICRRYSYSKLVMGGSGYSLAPKELLLHFDIDFGIAGEGEETLLHLVRSLEKKEPVCPCSQLLIKGKPFFPSIEGARVSTISGPDRTLFQNRRYFDEGGMGNIQTKRGCPFSCVYCTYPLLEGREMRLRKAGEVVDEIRRLREDHGIDYIYFVDDIFNHPPSFAEELCREIVRNKLNVRWSAFVNPGFLTESLLKWMKEAGCVGVEFGTDSMSESMLKNYGKSFTLKEVIRSSSLCSSLGVNHCHYLLFGGPGEDEETIEETFQRMDQLDPTAIIVMLGIRIYPGTEMARIALSEGMIDENTSLIYPHFYLSPKIRGSIENLLREKTLERRQWIVPGLEINISQNLIEGIRKFGIRGPLWELVGRMKRSRMKPLGGRGE